VTGTQDEVGMSVGPRATNGLDNALESGLTICDDLGLKAEPNTEFSEIITCSHDEL